MTGDIRFRIFRCSSSSVVGLWLSRLWDEENKSQSGRNHRDYWWIFSLCFVKKFIGAQFILIYKTRLWPTKIQSKLLTKLSMLVSNILAVTDQDGLEYLTSLQPICCHSSCRSISEVRGRMFFSSSSFLLGLLPSLIASVSLRLILLAREPIKRKLNNKLEMHDILVAYWVLIGIRVVF